MSTKENTAVPNHSLLISQASGNSSDASSEEQSCTPTTDQTALPESLHSGNSTEEVNPVTEDIERMNIMDPKEARQTNQDRCTYRGLNNEGATCYLNATLQVLFMTKAFRERVMGAPSDTNEKLVSALKEIFQELSNQDSGAPSVSTRGIIQSLGIQNVYEQQDAVEYFLDILEKIGPTLAEVFSGTLRNIRKCSNHHVSHDDSPFKSLQIPVITRDGQFKLDDGLDKYFESTILVEDDQMYCDACEEKSDTTLSCEIHEYPEILPLHLKRFEYDYRVRGFVKNHCPMDVLLHLPPKFFQEHEYSLYAVINHTGSRFSGHYTAVIRSFTENKWYRFDDSHVTVTDESKLKGSGEAYLLLYQKTSSGTGVEDMKEGREMKTAEPGELVEADRAECGGAHYNPQLEDPSLQKTSPTSNPAAICHLTTEVSAQSTMSHQQACLISCLPPSHPPSAPGSDKLAEASPKAGLPSVYRNLTVISSLGYIISAEGVAMDEGKVKSVLNRSPLIAIKELQHFLCFVHLNSFIRNFSMTAAPLTSLLRGRKQRITWPEEAQRAFQHLKKRFTTTPILQHSNPELEFTVEVDMSNTGIGAVLSQRQVSAVTGYLRILVLSRPETESLKVELSVVVSSESQPWHGEMCSPVPCMVLWVDPLKYNMQYKEAFEEIYRFLQMHAL